MKHRGDVGLLAILKFLLKRYFDREGYERAWRQSYNPGDAKRHSSYRP